MKGYDEVEGGFMVSGVDGVEGGCGEVCYVKGVRECVEWEVDEC